MAKELRVLIEGKVTLPGDIFESAEIIANTKKYVEELRNTTAQITEIEFHVTAGVHEVEDTQQQTVQSEVQRRKRRSKAEMEAARAAGQGGEQPAGGGLPRVTAEERAEATPKETVYGSAGLGKTAPLPNNEGDQKVESAAAETAKTAEPQPNPLPTATAAPDAEPAPQTAPQQPAKAAAPWNRAPAPAPVKPGRTPVYKADKSLFSTFATIEAAAGKIVDLIGEQTDLSELTDLMSANEDFITELPAAIRDTVFAAYDAAEARLEAPTPAMAAE